MALASRIEKIRRFNRFYTKHIGALNEGLLKSDFGLTEARIIYELAWSEPLTAAALTQTLGLDGGYVSRILQRFEKMGLLERTQSSEDARAKSLTLTHRGRAEFARLNEASKSEVAALLSTISDTDQEQLVDAMDTVTSLLGGRIEVTDFILRPPVPGDMGWVIQRHGQVYAREYGWNQEFEGLVAEIVSRFVRDFKPGREHCWIVEREGQNVGSVFLIEKTEAIAQLRLLLVEEAGRGLGIGTRLVQECSAFARKAGYQKLTLWTNDILHSARRIYQREGYRLVSEENHVSFGHDLVGQEWELEL